MKLLAALLLIGQLLPGLGAADGGSILSPCGRTSTAFEARQLQWLPPELQRQWLKQQAESGALEACACLSLPAAIPASCDTCVGLVCGKLVLTGHAPPEAVFDAGPHRRPPARAPPIFVL